MQKKITVGGSEIAGVMGMSRWTSPFKLFAEKTGLVEREDISGREAVELGTELEDFVARKFEKKSGIKVLHDMRFKREFFHPEHDYLVAHVDRRIEGTDEILECKTCSAYKEKEWDKEEIPTEYLMQVQWYLGITNCPKGYIAVLIGGQKFLWKEVVFDKELYDTMVEAAVRFVDLCNKGIAPMASSEDNSILYNIYTDDNGELVNLPEGDIAAIDVMLTERASFRSIIKDYEKRVDTVDALIKSKMGVHAYIETPHFKVSWKTSERTSVDTNALKQADLYDRFSVTTKQRRFTAKEK